MMLEEEEGNSSSSQTPAATPTPNEYLGWKSSTRPAPSAPQEEPPHHPNAKPGWYGHKHTCPALEAHRKLGINVCPFSSRTWDAAGNSHMSISRAQKDIAQLHTHEVDGIYLDVDENDLTFVHAMIVGTPDSPYAGGFFHFMFRFGPQYPFEPPRVCCMSSYRFGSNVRFHPNLYVNGFVCLSLLGTWDGPRWSAANNLASVLVSIQSIFTPNALCHEPGYEKFRGKKDSKQFDVFARHETLRVAVLETVKHAEAHKLPAGLIVVMRKVFLENFDSYIESCDELASYDQKPFLVSLQAIKGAFTPKFGELKCKLIELKKDLEEWQERHCSVVESSASITSARPKTFSAAKPGGNFSSMTELTTSLPVPVPAMKVADNSPDTINDGSDLWSVSDEEESEGESYVPSEDEDEDAAIAVDDSTVSLEVD